ncbi:hypothetical protein LUZ63_007873 [Rhynchospora breviuscula]|uniref:Exostosin GT47 domain-containing protein n=1 Tax=Rhynchospora breviuscula TaxID=2022672 RepID=A0A9Q0CSQ3_9POAL|nr:hypothetical protein LUZ63_007873 [Rhynchospora breviuscula]
MNIKVLTFLFFFSVVSYLLYPYTNSNLDAITDLETEKEPPTKSKQCDPDIAPFYIYDLPDRFNLGLLNNCSYIDRWKDMCSYFANQGMGQPFTKPNWYNTYQFTADMLFYARAVNHPCRTYNSSSALMFYIPFYASLYTHVFSHEINLTRRDALGVDLLEHISKQPNFRRHGGHDHFLPVGLMAWDFLRNPEEKDGKNSHGNKFLTLPQLSNVSIPIIERDIYIGKNQFGIPYPSYFHPKSKAEIRIWQNEVRRSKRTHLFSFVGGGRQKGHGSEKFRTAVINQCNNTENCILVFCKYWIVTWDAADEILGAMKRAHFCLQPPGDTWTRRSIFDSILAGCVPVFFSENTAYKQYTWYIPERREDWSVLIGPDQLDRIEEVLSQIQQEEVERMREAVIGMIPHVTYMHPNASWTEIGPRDVVDTALVELTKRMRARIQA